jgi:acid stress-induced BolA-like protein IbaG/YrbA
MNIKSLLLDDIAALDHLTVQGAGNCFIVSAVSNDLKRIWDQLNSEETKAEEEKKDVEAS